jgi:hypothetical protein
MAKTMLAISLLVGAGACSGAPTAVRLTPTTGAAPTTEPTTTEAPTTTVPEPTTTTSVAPEPVEEEPVTVPTTRARSAPTTVPYVATTVPVAGGDGACGGSLPPCSVMRRESGGDPTAVNATGCGGRGCYGKWQFDPLTSQALGYPGTMDQYAESVQDEAARTLYADGAGCSHWGAC